MRRRYSVLEFELGLKRKTSDVLDRMHLLLMGKNPWGGGGGGVHTCHRALVTETGGNVHEKLQLSQKEKITIGPLIRNRSKKTAAAGCHRVVQ